MAKILKRWMAKELTSQLEGVDSFVLFGYQKINAEQAADLRRQLWEKDINMTVVKNTVASIVFSEIYGHDMKDILTGAVAIAYGGESPADVAKAILDWNKKNKVLVVKGGYVPGKVMGADDVKALSQVPTKPVMLSLIAGVLQAPIQQIATIMAAPCQDMSYAIDAQIEKLEKAS